MVFAPMPRDVGAAAYPSVAAHFQMVHKLCKSARASGAPRQPAMQADGHHLRRLLGAQCFIRVAQVREEVVAGVEPLRGCEPHVVCVQCVGDDEVRLAVSANPIGHVVGVGVGVVKPVAHFQQKFAGVRAGAPDIPTFGRRADGLRVRFQRAAQVFALGLKGDEGIIYPAPAVRGDFPLGLFHRGDGFGVSRERHCDSEDGHGNASDFKHSPQPPEPGAGAVFVDGLHVHMADAGKGLRPDDFGEKRLGGGVAVEDAVFAPLLVVHDKLHGDARPAGPFRPGRMFAVSNEIAGIGCG